MALPTLDATFASAADVPRRYMLAQWLVGEKGEVAGPSSVLVSGAGAESANGTYTETGEDNGKKYYNKEGFSVLDQSAISWDGSAWTIWNVGADPMYTSTDDVEFPWQVTTWSEADGGPPLPTVTEVPALNPIANYITLPERYLWAKIAVAAGAPKDEAAYIGLPKQYAWKDIYDAVSGSSLGTIDWTEKQALGHIAAAYRGDTGTPENLATYIDWPWRYQVASIITQLAAEEEPNGNGNGGPTTFNAVIVSGAGSTEVNGTYTETGEDGGKKYYNLEGTSPIVSSIRWSGSFWIIYGSGVENMYESATNVEFPWQAENWSGVSGSSPSPTLTPTNV